MIESERISHIAPPPRTGRQSHSETSFDLLRVPLLGHALRNRWSRFALQLPIFLLAMIMIGHAFWGPQLAPKSLATLLTWVHFRGLVVLAILFAGNLFCMACPFMLPREAARRLFTPRWDWPRVLRNKWPAIILFVAVLFLYELFDLWSNPWWTGALILVYFVAALLVDLLFRRASFCKYVCPIGQFNFLSATLAPLVVAVRNATTCTSCLTKDCIRGARDGGCNDSGQMPSRAEALPIIQRGCELALFQPRKVGNLDCTFCLDCVYACPHDNIGVFGRLPAEELIFDGTRSGIGSIERRFDFTALIVVFTFGALLNALAMISPVYAVEQWIAKATGLRVEWPILTAMFAVILVLEPAILMGTAAVLARRATQSQESAAAIINRFARSLVPIGFGVWLAHYGFHFLTGCFTVIPVVQNSALQLFKWPILGEPLWQLGGLPISLVLALEIGFLTLGLVGSLLVSWSIARQLSERHAWTGFAPWAVLHVVLYASAMWIMMQPMDMRGTFLGN